MTAPADRCPTCDRAECDVEAAREEYHRVIGGGAYGEAAVLTIDRLNKANNACAAARVSWRAEALASRALLRELLGARPACAFSPPVEAAWAEVAARIREHLRSEP